MAFRRVPRMEIVCLRCRKVIGETVDMKDGFPCDGQPLDHPVTRAAYQGARERWGELARPV